MTVGSAEGHGQGTPACSVVPVVAGRVLRGCRSSSTACLREAPSGMFLSVTEWSGTVEGTMRSATVLLFRLACLAYLLAPSSSEAQSNFVSAPFTGAAVVSNPSFQNVYVFVPTTPNETWDQHIAAFVAANGGPTGLEGSLSSETSEAIDALTKAILQSGYFTFAKQYGVNPPIFSGSKIANQACLSQATSQSLSFGGTSAFVNCEYSIESNLAQVLNLIISPDLPNPAPDFGSPICNGISGFHTFNASGNFTLIPLFCNTSLAALSETISHEMVETATDPAGFGWIHETVPGRFLGGLSDITNEFNVGEIGDICQVSGPGLKNPSGDNKVQDMPFLMLVVARYWSNADNQCEPQFDAPPGRISFNQPSASESFNGQGSVIQITGFGLGPAPPNTGLVSQIATPVPNLVLNDATTNAAIGNSIDGGGSQPGLSFDVWTDTGMTAFAPAVSSGDQISIQIWNSITGQGFEFPITPPIATSCMISITTPPVAGFYLSRPPPTLNQEFDYYVALLDQFGKGMTITPGSITFGGNISAGPSFSGDFVPPQPGKYFVTAAIGSASCNATIPIGPIISTIQSPIPNLGAEFVPLASSAGDTVLTLKGQGFAHASSVSFGQITIP